MVADLDYHLDENLELVESEEVQSDLQALDCCLAKSFFDQYCQYAGGKQKGWGQGGVLFIFLFEKRRSLECTVTRGFLLPLFISIFWVVDLQLWQIQRSMEFQSPHPL